MLTTADFLTATQWTGIAAIVLAVLTVLGFIFQWGIRFRMVGITGFTLVLTGGLFALSLVPFIRTTIPGSVPFSVVYDNGSTLATIAVPPQITESELDATLRQAASNLFSYGRLGQGDNQFLIRARTIIHPEPGVSQPLYLGQVKRSLSSREGDQIVEIYPDRLAQLAQPSAQM